MDKYLVSARKYRPATFDSVVGQQALTTTLKNAIASGKLAHAYLFCGPRGVGKTTCARIFAKTINCLHPNEQGEACDQCESCIAFNEGRSYNIHELDAASNNSVEDIRQLIEQVQIPPQVGRYKVFIIDEVHMLSTAAFNAFLKTLEEPPAHAIFILATTEKHKILPTILSRCQIYDFNRMEVGDIVAHLKRVAEAEQVTYEEEALGVIARKADGGMRDALSIFDQVTSFADGNITYKKVIEDLNLLDDDYYFKITDQLLKPDIAGALLTLNEVLSNGFEAHNFISGLAAHFRNLLVAREPATLPLLEAVPSMRQRYQEQAQRCRPVFLYSALKRCNDCDLNYRTSRNKRLLVELTLIETAQATADDAPGCGPGPTKRLKPLFKTTEAAAQPRATTTQTAAAAPKTAAPTPQPTAAPPTARPTAQTPAPAAPQPRPAGPAAARTAAPQRKTAHTLSIHLYQPAEEQPAAMQVAEDDVPESETPFDKNELYYQWYRFANSLPQEQSAMSARLKNMEPVLQENWHVETGVENQQVLQSAQALKNELLKYLRQQLRNGKITLEFRLLEASENKRAYSRQEQYAQMLQHSPALVRLAQALHLELS